MSVLITRPDKEGKALSIMLKAQNIPHIHYPLIKITKGKDVDRLPQKLTNKDMIIAVSQHAVHWAKKSLQTHSITFPNHIHYLAVGEKTAQELEKYCSKPVIYPSISDSEHLLDCSVLKSVENKRILILRGDRGRELLKETLEMRGAQVEYAEMYQRIPLTITEKEWQNWKDNLISKVVITSGEQLYHFSQQAPKHYQDWLTQLTLLVPSQRIEQQAKQLGFTNIVNTQSASNAVLLKNLSQDDTDDR